MKAAVLLLIVFMAGAVAGGALTGARSERALASAIKGSPSEAIEGLIVWRLTRALDLTSDQERQVRAVLAAHRAENRAARKKIAAELIATSAREEVEISSILDPKQRLLFADIAAAWNASRREYLDGR